MRRINFKEPDTIEWKKWRKDCQKNTADLIKLVQSGNRPKIRKSLYKRQKKVYFNTEGAFFGKCAYCEGPIKTHDDLDHFRPIRKVTDENDKVIKIRDKRGRLIEHPGYYWLAYDWKNLLPSCKECNSPSTQKGTPIGKRNRFPVAGNHECNPNDRKKGKALLVHPVFDRPKVHFSWDQSKKLIFARTKKGEICIKIFGFYDREALIISWAEEYNNVIKDLSSALNPNLTSEQRRINTKNIKNDIEKGKRKYSLVAREALKEYRSLLE